MHDIMHRCTHQKYTYNILLELPVGLECHLMIDERVIWTSIRKLPSVSRVSSRCIFI